jgi:hypothetical protein
MVDDWYDYQIAAFKRMAIPSKGRHYVNALTGGQEFPITILQSKPTPTALALVGVLCFPD